MRVLVTGAEGRVGKWVVGELLGHDGTVVAVDRRISEDDSLANVIKIKSGLGEVDELVELMRGCDAVVHLAAIASPRGAAGADVFANNTQTTYNVLEAATRAGVRKSIIASSGAALGFYYAERECSPIYAPIDEEHPLLPQDPYALSKEVTERIAAMFYRRVGCSVMCYRFPGVLTRAQSVESARQAGVSPAGIASRALWNYIDCRDLARAFWLGIERPWEGHHVLNVCARDTLASVPTEELLARYHPSTEIRTPMPGYRSVWSVDKAQRLLEFEPRHSWRDL